MSASSRTAALLLGVVLVLGGSARGARAQTTGEAREHYRKGTAAYNLGRYLEAAQEYERAYEVTLDPALLFNVAQAYRLAGEPKKALTTYRSYLRSAPNGDRREMAEAKIRELEAEQARTPAVAPPRSTAPPAAPTQAPAPIVSAPASVPAPAPLETAPPPPANDAALTLERAPAREDSPVPLTHRWAFWAVVGAVVVGGAVGIALVASSSSSGPSPQTALGTMRF